MVVLAVESDPKLISRVRHVVCDLVRARLTLVRSVDLAIRALETETPDLILLPALVSPGDEARLLAALRNRHGCGHVEMLITPAFEEKPETVTPRGWRRWGSRRAADSTTSHDELRLFAERLGWSLARACQQKQLLEQERSAASSSPVGEDQLLPVEAVEHVEKVEKVDTAATIAVAPASQIGEIDEIVDVVEPADHVDAASVATEAREADLHASGEETIVQGRRASPRFRGSELQGLREARLVSGGQVSLLDVSVGGALIETDARLKPDAESVLELVGHTHKVTVPFRVARSQAALVDGALRYRGACEFSQALELAGLLAEPESASDSAAPLSGWPVDDLLEVLERQLPSLRRDQLLKLLSSLRSGQPPSSPLEREALDLLSLALSAATAAGVTVAATTAETAESHESVSADGPVDHLDDPADRRQHIRVSGPFDGLRLGAIETPVTIRDLSVGGCFVHSLVEAKAGRRLSIGLLVPGEDWITTTGEVVRGQPAFGFAIRFVELPDETRTRLARVIASRSGSGTAGETTAPAFVAGR